MRILFADDDPVSRALLRAVFASLGHATMESADGGEAWRLYERERARLVVLDLDMPTLDGLEVCRRIRAVDTQRETFILVLTGRDGHEALREVLDAGADDYLTKPASPESVRARLTIAERRIQLDEARRRAEAELARARWLAGVGEATITVQHEINNPLSALLGHAELLQLELRERGLPSESVDVIVSQAKRIADVVRRVSQLRDPKSVEYVGKARMIDLKNE